MIKDFLDSFMVFLSTIGNNGFIWFLLAIILLAKKSWRQAGWYTLLSVLAGGIAQFLLKELFKRPRPITDPATLLIEMPTSYSFPSGHALISFCAAATLSVFMPRLGRAAMLLAILISISRVYLGVHYISDVIFGAIIGMGLSYLILRLRGWNRIWRRQPDQGI